VEQGGKPIRIRGVAYELCVSKAGPGRIRRLEEVMEIPLSRIGLESLFDVRTAASILRLVEQIQKEKQR
jgi:hypothetical protein